MSVFATALMPTTPKPTPRWLYAFFDFIQHLPIPAWLLGLLVILIGSLALQLVAWQLGVLPNGSLSSYLITLTPFPLSFLAIWILLNRRARLALTAFFKSSNKPKAKLENAFVDFISLPPVLSTPGFLLGILIGYFNFQSAVRLEPLASQVLPAYSLISFMLVGGFAGMTVFRAVRQAVILRRFLRQVEVNIFNPAPLYALSRYASQSSLTLLLLNYTLILLSLPAFLFTTDGYIESAVFIISALTLFFAPFGSIYRRMREEKDRLLAELGKDLDELYASAHQAVRRKDYARLDKMRNAASILKDGWEIVRKIPTWPWEPETVRNLLIPFLIPVIAFLVQRYLGSLFGG